MSSTESCYTFQTDCGLILNKVSQNAIFTHFIKRELIYEHSLKVACMNLNRQEVMRKRAKANNGNGTP